MKERWREKGIKIEEKSPLTGDFLYLGEKKRVVTEEKARHQRGKNWRLSERLSFFPQRSYRRLPGRERGRAGILAKKKVEKNFSGRLCGIERRGGKASSGGGKGRKGGCFPYSNKKCYLSKRGLSAQGNAKRKKRSSLVFRRKKS